MKVVALQFEPVHGQVQRNWTRALELLDRLPAHAGNVVVLPEMALSGYLWPDPHSITPIAKECSDAKTQQLWVEAAVARHMWFVIGHPAMDEITGDLRNRCTLVSPHGIIGHYDKTCLYEADLTWATPGSMLPPLWETPWGLISPLICADLDYPEPIESAVCSGAQAIVFPTAWVEEPGPSATWTLRAWEHNIPIIAADIIGHDGATIFSGGSAIISSDGSLLETLDYDEGAITHELVLSKNVEHIRSAEIALTEIKCDFLSHNENALNIATFTLIEDAKPFEEILRLPWPSADVYLLSQIQFGSVDEHLDLVNAIISHPHREGRPVVGSTYLMQKNPVCIVWVIQPNGAFVEISRLVISPLQSQGGCDAEAYQATTLTLGNIKVAAVGAWALEKTAVVRALSAEGVHLILATGVNNLPAVRYFPGTSAGFGNGMDAPDEFFAHPARFRAGDSNVWIAFASHQDSLPGGVFSPNHIRWPRQETLISNDGWITSSITISPDDVWGIDALEKPVLSKSRKDLYPQNWKIRHKGQEND